MVESVAQVQRVKPAGLVTRQAELIRYPVEEDIAEWAAREVVLSDAEVFRRFDLALSPWSQAVFDWFRDYRTEQIHLIQGSQTAKTLSMMVCLFWASRFRPDVAFWIGATEGEAIAFVRHRLKGMIEDSGALPERKADCLARELRLNGMLLRVVWASSAKKIRGYSVQYIFGDETGIWPRLLPGAGEPIAYVWKRTRAHADGGRKAIFSTTPSDLDAPSWKRATAAAFHRWYVPCPRCGAFQYLSFWRLKFDHCRREDGTWDMPRVRRETYYECEHCRGRVHEREKRAMTRAGHLQRVDPDTGAPLDVPPDREVALQIPATYSPFTPWGDLAASFLEAKRQGPDTYQTFVTDELAEPWQESGEAVEPEAIRKCIDEDREPGAVPVDTLAITAAADVQEDRIYYVVRAWLLGMASILLRYGVLPRDPADRGLSALDEILLTDYGGHEITQTFIDSGFEPDFVYDYCLRSDLPRAKWGSRIAPSKGAGLTLTAAGTVTGSSSQAMPVMAHHHGAGQRLGRRRVLPGDLTIYHVNTDWAKQWILHHVRIQPGDPGEWRLPCTVDEDYLQQVMGEERIQRKGKWLWRVKDPRRGSHYLDCEVLARAAAWLPVQVHTLKGPAGSAASLGRTWTERRVRR